MPVEGLLLIALVAAIALMLEQAKRSDVRVKYTRREKNKTKV